MQLIQILAITGSLLLFAFVIDFVRRGLLKEKYSLLWLGLSTAIITLSLWKELLDRIAVMVGVAYPPSLLFFVALLFMLLIMLHFSVVISILHDKNKTLAQELSILKASLDKTRESVKSSSTMESLEASEKDNDCS
ncbi:MAG: DUF2304 domain-containing protein [Deltaproteobacteria bacterium]|nr:DUF2304 domain-containing protein [Deltaproteobacteria bacterium]